MKALTIQQPWAGLIALGAKDVENRTWKPGSQLIGERFVVHAGARAVNIDRGLPSCSPAVDIDDDHPLCRARSRHLATVRLVAVVRDHPSPWAAPGHWHWVLADPRVLRGGMTDVHVRGQQGLWDA